MAITIEELNEQYKGREEDNYWLEMQARIGTDKERAAAWGPDGKFHCIKWFNCDFCPAFNAEHCL